MKIKVIALVAVYLLSWTQVAQSDAWLDDWVDAKTVTSPGYYKGQTRGYFSGGSFQARWKMGNEDLIDFQAPRLEFGCGGMNLFGGSVSFLDADRLADKMQSILQAAPAVAVDMALKTMCKECSETVRSLEGLANKLNGMMQSDCQMSKTLARKYMPEVPKDNFLNNTVAKLNSTLGITRDYQETTEAVIANDGKPQVDLRVATEKCSANFKAIYKEGSLIKNIADDMGFSDYENLLRGLMGDVDMVYDDVNHVYEMHTVPSCRENDPYSLDDFLNGSLKERAIGATCQDNSSIDFNTYVSNHLDSISGKIEAGAQGISADEQAFINTSPLPVLQTLRLGIITGDPDGAKASLRDALSVSLAYHAIDDLFKQVRYLIHHAKQSAQDSNATNGNANRCDPIVFAPAIKELDTWKLTIEALRKSARESYRSEIESLANYQILIRNIVDQYRAASNETFSDLVK